MRKLLIVPAILAMTSLSGSAFAQHVGDTTGSVGNNSPTTANGSSVTNFGSPVIETNVAVPINISVLSSGNQSASATQGNFTSIGIGAASNFIGH